LFALLARRVHPRVLTAYTLLWGLAAYVIYANVFQSTGAALLAAVGVGIAANGGVAAFYAISPSIYPTAARGTGVGWMVGFGRIVSILAPIVSGYLIDGGMKSQSLYQIYGVILAIGAGLVFVLHRSMKSDSTSMVEDTPVAVH
jgi:MFS family permease